MLLLDRVNHVNLLNPTQTMLLTNWLINYLLRLLLSYYINHVYHPKKRILKLGVNKDDDERWFELIHSFLAFCFFLLRSQTTLVPLFIDKIYLLYDVGVLNMYTSFELFVSNIHID